MSFTNFDLSPELLRTVRDRGHHQATDVQLGAIPIAMTGRDLVATAETGSGKTAAYLLPLLDRLHRKKLSGPAAMILAPTRELAAQIGREFSILARHTRLRPAVIVGGESMNQQLNDLRNGAQVLIACPGRLIDHIERGSVRLDKVEVVVIDEADRLLDMGFLPQLRRIMKMAPHKRQTMMFSATMPMGVRHIAREFLDHPEHITIGAIAVPPSSIRQFICPVTQQNKGPLLLAILSRPEVESAIVFTRTRSRAESVSKMLTRNEVRAVAIHGDRSQSQRNAALAGFTKGRYRVMVATDVAARGLDIPDVSHVINFDLPDETENYVHRIGRTARMGKPGIALTLVAPEQRVELGRIERALGITLEREHVEGFEALEIEASKPAKVFKSFGGGRGRATRNRPRMRWA